MIIINLDIVAVNLLEIIQPCEVSKFYFGSQQKHRYIDDFCTMNCRNAQN